MAVVLFHAASVHRELIIAAESPPCLAWQSFPAAGHKPSKQLSQQSLSREWHGTEAHRGRWVSRQVEGSPNWKNKLEKVGKEIEHQKAPGFFVEI